MIISPTHKMSHIPIETPAPWDIGAIASDSCSLPPSKVTDDSLLLLRSRHMVTPLAFSSLFSKGTAFSQYQCLYHPQTTLISFTPLFQPPKAVSTALVPHSHSFIIFWPLLEHPTILQLLSFTAALQFTFQHNPSSNNNFHSCKNCPFYYAHSHIPPSAYCY